MAKFLHVQYKYNNTIVALKFQTIPRRGWFAENVKPMIDVIKAMVPATFRTYEPTTHEWEIAVSYWSPLETVFKASGWTIVMVDESAKQNGPKVVVDKEYEENFYRSQEPVVTKEAPASIAKQLSMYLGVEITTQELSDLKKLYRAKARELHPDFGGDAAKMSELNRLWTLYSSNGVVQ